MQQSSNGIFRMARKVSHNSFSKKRYFICYVFIDNICSWDLFIYWYFLVAFNLTSLLFPPLIFFSSVLTFHSFLTSTPPYLSPHPPIALSCAVLSCPLLSCPVLSQIISFSATTRELDFYPEVRTLPPFPLDLFCNAFLTHPLFCLFYDIRCIFSMLP